MIKDLTPRLVHSKPTQTWAELREKVPNVLSRFHTKRRTGAQGPRLARPSFFWYDKDSGYWGPFRVMQPRHYKAFMFGHHASDYNLHK